MLYRQINSRDRYVLSESDQHTDRVASTTSINQLVIMRERMQQPTQGCCWVAHSVPIFGHWSDSKNHNLRARYSFVGPCLAVGTVCDSIVCMLMTFNDFWFKSTRNSALLIASWWMKLKKHQSYTGRRCRLFLKLASLRGYKSGTRWVAQTTMKATSNQH
jgi:hypothetical protein